MREGLIMSRVVRGGITLVAGGLLSAGLVNGQAAAEAKVPLAEDVFKNVQVLKGIPVDEFMSTMGIFSAALGMSCEDCHASNDSNWANYALDTSVEQQIARKMVVMMATINKDNFGGRQVVPCYSCHRGSTPPKVTPNLNTLSNAVEEPGSIVQQGP